MNKTLFLLGLLAGLCGTLAANTQVLVDEDFSDISDWTDLSLVPLWGDDGSGQPYAGHTAFEVAANAEAGSDVVQLIRSGPEDTRPYIAFTRDLKTFTAIDRLLPQVIDHDTTILTVDVRLKWEQLEPGGRPGERGRFMLIFNNDYPGGPDGGLFLTPEGQPGSKIDDFTQENWWARPPYHLRVRSGPDGNASALLEWGGGKPNEGQYEELIQSGEKIFWIPGFISGAFVAEGISNSPGVGGPQWPYRSWKHTTQDWTFDAYNELVESPHPSERTSLASDSQFYTIRWVLSPDKQEAFVDFDDDGTFVKHGEMQLPQANPLHPNYRYFEEIEGFRLFWSGNDDGNTPGDEGQVYVDHLTITAEFLDAPELPGLTITKISETEAELRYTTQAGQTYQLWSTTDIADHESWEPLGGEVEGDGSSVTVPVDLTAGTRDFYEVSTQLVTP